MFCPTIEQGLWSPISLIMNWPSSTEKSGLLITRWHKCRSKGVWCGNGHWAVLLITVLCARDKWTGQWWCMQLVTWYIGSVTGNGVQYAIMYSRIDPGWTRQDQGVGVHVQLSCYGFAHIQVVSQISATQEGRPLMVSGQCGQQLLQYEENHKKEESGQKQ